VPCAARPALGVPDVLALYATHELSKGSWPGRHPWLAWVARRMPGGWRLLGMTTGVLALCSTALHMSIQAPVSGPGSGQLMVGVQGPGGLLVAVLARLLGGSGFGTWSDSVSGPFAWAQSAVLLIGEILVRLGPTVWARSVEGTRCAGEKSGG
jgi:hypothetical protein